jgi:hypothetical protein
MSCLTQLEADNEMLPAERLDEFVQKLKHIEGDATENIVIAFLM